MFGYVKVDKEELRVKEYNLFKAHYCGLCQTLKKEYGFPARYFLSNDLTFLALLLSAVSEEEERVCPIRCLANPTRKRPALRRNKNLSYAAAVNVLLVWFKLLDDWQDERSVRAAFLMPLMRGKMKKAGKRYPELYEGIESALVELSCREKSQTPVADEPAAAFGKLMAAVFDAPVIESETNRRILSHIGFLLGRYIYLLDAWADREKDRKKHAYNPFLLPGALPKEEVRLSLEYTLSELGNSLGLLDKKRHGPILENMVFLGLQKEMRAVFEELCRVEKEKEKRHERPI